EVEDIPSTRKAILQAVGQHEGYVSSDRDYNLPGRKSNTVEVRVPAANFDSFLSDATAKVKRFDSKTINVKDVTEEFLDVETRVKTKKALEARYIELLERAGKVSEMLEIEREIGQLRV